MQELQIRWQHADTGVRILQVYSELTCIHIPDHIDGFPVTEIGPYCFSASCPRQTKEDQGKPFFLSDIVYTDSESERPVISEERKIPAPSLPALNGKYVEEITLPSAVLVLHNAAFYNCRNLHLLSVGCSIRAIGSDEFTNCSRLTRLIYRGNDRQAAGLSLILERIETDLEAVFINDDSSVLSSLFFPEYYEWLDEISPAHLFSRSIHGEGFRMRKSFQNGQLDYGKYDGCFENALKTESDKTVCLIALNRLRWPNNLQESYRQIYEQTIRDHFDTTVSMAIRQRDLDLLRFLFTDFSPDLSSYTDALQLGIETDWGEGTAWLMEAKYQAGSFVEKTYDFDDL